MCVCGGVCVCVCVCVCVNQSINQSIFHYTGLATIKSCGRPISSKYFSLAIDHRPPTTSAGLMFFKNAKHPSPPSPQNVPSNQPRNIPHKLKQIKSVFFQRESITRRTRTTPSDKPKDND